MKAQNAEMNTQFYKRSGEKVSRETVQRSQIAYAVAKRTGKMGDIRCSIQPTIADRIESMTAEQFSGWSGQFTFKKVI